MSTQAMDDAFEPKTDAVSKVLLSNKKTCLNIDNIHHLIEYVWSTPHDAETKKKWLKMIADYQQAKRILWKWSESTEEDIFPIENR